MREIQARTIKWKGQSGTEYPFWIYSRGTEFPDPCPGIYIHAKEISAHQWRPVYIGQTEDINVRLRDHEQRQCVNDAGAGHIHVGIVKDEQTRLAIEKDLILQWQPNCNTHYCC